MSRRARRRELAQSLKRGESYAFEPLRDEDTEDHDPEDWTPPAWWPQDHDAQDVQPPQG